MWSLLNEFLDSFDFVFEFPDLDPQIVGDRAVGIDYELFASRIAIASSSACLGLPFPLLLVTALFADQYEALLLSHLSLVVL